MKTETERIVDFLVGLTKLTRETQIEISGCGCCGSPQVSGVEQKKLDDEQAGYGYGSDAEIRWISRCDANDWQYFSKSIVRKPT